MISMFGEFIIGLVVLSVGSELLLRGAAGLKRFFRVPEFVIGLVIVGFGTSLPELIIGLGAAGVGAQELALGMVIGSNLFNLLGVLAIAALIKPLPTEDRALKRDGAFMALAALALGAVSLTGRLGVYEGVGLLILLGLYVAVVTWGERRLPPDTKSLHGAKADFAGRAPKKPWVCAVFALGGAALLTLGSGWVIEATVGLAFDMGVGEAILGLSLVAIATSAPELVVSIMAARRGQHGVAVGNVLGSNIFNGFGVAGLMGVFYGTEWPLGIIRADLIAVVAASLVLWLALASDRCLTRREGAVALTAYILYMIWRLGLIS